jgi:hypothetical protein
MKWLAIFLIFISLLACGTLLRKGTGVEVDSPNGDVHSVSSLGDSENEVIEPLPDFGPAPELENEVWLNTDRPLRLADLRGKVVLLDMWTFG